MTSFWRSNKKKVSTQSETDSGCEDKKKKKKDFALLLLDGSGICKISGVGYPTTSAIFTLPRCGNVSLFHSVCVMTRTARRWKQAFVLQI